MDSHCWNILACSISTSARADELTNINASYALSGVRRSRLRTAGKQLKVGLWLHFFVCCASSSGSSRWYPYLTCFPCLSPFFWSGTLQVRAFSSHIFNTGVQARNQTLCYGASPQSETCRSVTNICSCLMGRRSCSRCIRLEGNQCHLMMSARMSGMRLGALVCAPDALMSRIWLFSWFGATETSNLQSQKRSSLRCANFQL